PVVAKGLGWPLERIPGLTWLASNPFGLPIEPLTQGVLISLVGNFALFGLVSVLSRTRVSEHWQASRFIGQEISQRQNSRFMLAVQVEDLLMLAARFVGEERARQSFIRFAYRQGKGFTPNQTANNEWIAHTERLLAGVLGASSARAVVKAAIEGREMQVEDVVRIADEASEVLQFNRALLQGAIENITQGISVVDQSLRLVAWNHRYLELFEYPDGLIYVGRPIADIIRYNADRGLCGPGDPDMHVAKRLYWMRQGTPHTSERLFPNGRVIELIGNPMPGGGFVMSFTDITAYREAEQGLKGANESLEQRVQERTQELSQLNQELSEAKSNAEAANQSKTRYFGDADNLDSRYLRYDTYWLYNDERNMHSYQLGDYVNGALNWTTPVRMGGFRFARNFGVRPDLVTYPLLRFDGQAAVPSTVDLFINGYKASSADLQPGPFAISNVPYINGAGEATVVTTDAQGRQVVTSLPFYVSNTLLARGLSDFDLSVGRLRDDYGLRNFSYADNAASGIYRYGVSDRLTLSTHAEAASDLRLLGIGGDIAVATFGTLSLAASGSDGQGDSGQQYLLGYSYYSRRLGLSLQHIERSAGYGDLGTLDGEYQLSRRTDQATASLTFDEQGTIGAGYFDIRARDGSRTRLANLSYSRPIGSRSSFYLALNKDLDGDGYSALMQLVIPFDINGLLNIGVTRDSDRRYSERVIWSRSTPSQGGLGWNLGYGGGASRYQQADLTWRMQNVQLQGGLYGETGNYTRWADLSGSLVWMDNAVFASNRINDAFVLVSTKGYPQVPIRYENQLMGSTDDNGHLLVPWVAAYYPAKFQIEPLDLPANVSAPEVEQRVAVRQGSGLLLDFPIRAVVAASISLVDERGEPLPLGSRAEETGSGQRASVGWDGQVYFEGLQSDNQLRVVRPDGRACQARFRLDTRKPTVSQVGPLTCSAPIGDTP
ncbi:PAS-domain containing protein, partial [Pseudomonas aeruginosa]|nr:PAS-domain containing protein [Pseudomonas aeruginosa]